LKSDMVAFLNFHGYTQTATHCLRVGEEARRLALRFDLDPALAEAAGWLHDISAPIPNAERAAAATQFGVDILPEELSFPMILHQKLSVVLAQDIFGVQDPAILSAIGCHTTLKAGATRLDQVVFLADKIEWDGAGPSPFKISILQGCDQSLAHGVFAYLDHLWQQRHHLGVIHPWFQAAYQEFAACVISTPQPTRNTTPGM